MQGAVFTGDRNIELRDFPEPTPGPGDVVHASDMKVPARTLFDSQSTGKGVFLF